MSMRFRQRYPGAVLTLLLVACVDNGPKRPEVLTALPRALTTQETAIIEAGNAFTLALFQRASAAEPAKNVFLSPLSASMALGMTLNGARNETFNAMRNALQFGDASQADINAGYKSLISLLTGLDPTTDMRIANSVWFEQSFSVRPEFAAAAQEFFAARVTSLDFFAPPAVPTINNWVSEQTAGRITGILERIEADDRMFLINAIYFKGSWRTAFDPADTKPGEFEAASGAKQSAQMMHLTGATLSAGTWADGTVVAQLPYGNTAFNMMVILPPDTANLDAFVARLTPAKWQELMMTGPERETNFAFPRLKLEYRRELTPDLEQLGMGVAFTGLADFSGMSNPSEDLSISSVLQKTFLVIDEEGTEAAAVTKVGIRVTSLPPTIVCDRPYLIAIRERLSGTIVFIGKINSM